MPNSYGFDDLPDRRSTESVKWNYYDEDVLPMWVADMDFRSPEPVIRALHERVEHGVFGYPEEMPEFRRVLVERLLRLYQWKIEPEDIVFLPGVVTGFNLVSQALAQPGQAALIQTPVYPPFLSMPCSAGLERQEAELTLQADGTYSIDMDGFRAAFTGKTGLFLLCNPHNPVGRVFRREELESMAEVCLSNGVPICSDEIHCDLVYSGHRHLPIASLDAEIARNTVTLMAPSKTFNIAGLECSVAIIQNPALREKVQKARRGVVGGVNIMGLVAGLTAYKEGQPWLSALLRYLEGNRDYLLKFVQEELPEIRMASPEGTYLAWLDCRDAGIPGKPYEFFLERGRVALNPGETFGRGGRGFVRLNFGCPRAMLRQSLERMRHALLEERQAQKATPGE